MTYVLLCMGLLAFVLAGFGIASAAQAQPPSAEQRRQTLTSPADGAQSQPPTTPCLAPMCTPLPTDTPTFTFTPTPPPTNTFTPTLPPTNNPTYTSTATPNAILIGHVIWEGIFQPNSRNVQPISLTLTMGGTQIDYPTQNTDASGFFTVSVDGLASGAYGYRVKDPKFLANAGAVTLTGAPTTQLEIGTMIAGDANNDNVSDAIDYSILRANFGRGCGSDPLCSRADFDNNGTVNSIDLSMCRHSFGKLGAPPDSAVPPSSGNAFLSLQPGSAGNCPAPANGGTVQLGCRFVLDMMVNMGSVPDSVAMQSYMTFTSSILPNARVDSIATSCVPTDTVVFDLATFDVVLQSFVCNGPAPCTYRGMTVDAGSLAYAAGALSNCPTGCGGAFRVAQIGLCAVASGQAVLHWQFSPPAPRNRHTAIVDVNGNMVQGQSLFTDYVINVVAVPIPTDTPVPSNTNTPTPTIEPTWQPSPTFTFTHTNTPTSIPTDTNTPVPSSTNTPIPPGVVNGHLTWQGVEPANRPVVTGTLTLCVSGSQQSFGPFNTDANGSFTITTNLPDSVYHWRMKGGRHISTSSPTDGGDLVIRGGQATQEFGIQKGGDTDNTNIVNAVDFSNLKLRFGREGVWSSDFDYNLLINVLDYNILKTNFGQGGHTLTCP